MTLEGERLADHTLRQTLATSWIFVARKPAPAER